MSANVDERIVQMQFDNQQFEAKAQNTITTLNALSQALQLPSASTKGFTQVQESANKLNFDRINQAIETVNYRFSTFGIMATNVLNRISNAAIDMGKTLISSVTSQPLKDGFSEYETKMDSVKRILNSAKNADGSAVSLAQVNDQLDELNRYADKTIYNFMDMTTNIGKFTNAGVGLNESVKAIQGIANEAALSGANAQEASRAMYNFAQALSSGYVKLIDWKSIENANMATVGFKEELLKTAVALGTVTKEGDKYKTVTTDANGKVSDLFNSTEGFNDALSHQWMTADVLTQTLARYADETTDIGKAAFKAATEVMTFSKLIDTLKEALGSGWTESWELIIGDFDEAKELWTAVNNVLSDLINNSAESRNKLLEDWRALGGREAMIQGLKEAWNGVLNVIRNIYWAIQQVFPKIDGFDLTRLSTSFRALMTQFREFTGKYGPQISFVTKGVASVFDLLLQTVSAVYRTIAPIFGPLGEVMDLLIQQTGLAGRGFSDFVAHLRETDAIYNTLQKFVGVLQKVATFAANAAKSVLSFFGVNIDIEEGTGFIESITAVFEAFTQNPFVAGGIDLLNKIRDAIVGFFAGLKDSEGFQKVVNGLMWLGEALAKIGGAIRDSVVDMFTKLGGALKELFTSADGESFDFDRLFDIGALGAVGLVFKKLYDVLKGKDNPISIIKGFFKDLSSFQDLVKGASEAFSGFAETITAPLKALTTNIKADMLLKIATAVGVLTAAIWVLSRIEPGKMGVALTGVAAIMGELTVAMAAMTRLLDTVDGKNFAMVGATMISFSIAIGLISVAVAGLSKIDPDKLVNGVLAIGVLMTLMTLMTKLGDQNLSSKGMVGLAAAVLILQVAVQRLSELEPNKLANGVLAVSSLMLMMTMMSKLGGKNFSGAGLIGMAAAVLILQRAVATFSEFDTTALIKGVGAVSALILVMGLFSRISGKNALSASLGTIAIALAMDMLQKVVAEFGAMDTEALGNGLLATAASLAAMALALNAMTGTLAGAAALLIAVAALKLLLPVIQGLAALPFNDILKGVAGLAATFVVLIAAGTAMAPLIPVFLGFAGAIALIGVGSLALGAGLVVAAAGIAALSTAMVAGTASILASIGLILAAVIEAVPIIVMLIAQGIIGILKSIGDSAATIVQVIVQIGVALIDGLRALLRPLGEFVVEALLFLIQLLTDNTPTLVNALVELVITAIDGIALAIYENTDKLIAAVHHVLGAILDFILATLQEILSGIPGVGGKINDALAGVREDIAKTMSKEEGEKIGSSLTQGVADGAKSGKDSVSSAGAEVGDAGKASILGGFGGVSDSVKELVGSQLSGAIGDASGDTSLASFQLGEEGAASLLEGFGDTNSIGKYLNEGVANGLLDNQGLLTAATSSSAESLLSDLNSNLGINSPSTKTWEMGKYLDEGLANGVTDNKSIISTAVTGLGSLITGGFNSLVSAFSNAGKRHGTTYAQGVSSIAPTARNAGGTVVTSTVSALTAGTVKFRQNGSVSGLTYASGITSTSGNARTAGSRIGSSAATGIGITRSAFSSAGRTSGSNYASGIASRSGAARSAGSAIGSSAVSGARSVGGFYDAGRDSSQGYLDGLLSKARQIASSAADMVRNALNSARNAIDSHSPSRAYERLGEDSDQGYINGVQKRAGRVNSALDTLARDAMGAFYEGLTRANDAATDEFAITPTVSPVMDLNGVYGGVDYLRNVFNGAGSVLGSITADVDNNIADIRELVVNTRQILASLKGRKPITIDGRTVIGWVDTELGAL